MIDNILLKNIISNPNIISDLDSGIIIEILNNSRKNNINEKLLLEIEVNTDEKIIVIGDIHGNLETLLKLVHIIKKISPKYIIFLGDIVDRGLYQIESLIVILCLKLLEPNRYFILRGNHETIEMNRYYGFHQEFMNRYQGEIDFNYIIGFYDSLSLSCIINNYIFCVHGGIPTYLEILDEIKDLKIKDRDLISRNMANAIMQMMWNDPKENIIGFSNSFRGSGIYNFGKDVFDAFLEKYGLSYLIRAHEAFPDGYRWFFNNKLLSVFSSANYHGYGFNPASYAIISNNNISPKLVK